MMRGKTRKNPQFLYHGGRMQGPPEVRPHSKGRGESGAGIYTTTAWSTAKRFSRGGAIFRLTLADNIRWIDQVKVPLRVLLRFLDSLPRVKHREKVRADILEAAQRRGDPLPLLSFHNLLINNDATVGQHGPAVAKFLVECGADAEHSPQGGDEDWVIVFNPDVILKVERLDPKKAGKDYPFDQPRVKRNPRMRLPPGAFIVTRTVRKYLFEAVLGYSRDTIIGYVQASLQERPGCLAGIDYSAADPGYGPALYDAVALVAKATGAAGITPGGSQSLAAQALWSRNASGHPRVWHTPTLDEYKGRYGVDLETLLTRGQTIPTQAREHLLDDGTHFYADHAPDEVDDDEE